MQLEKSITCPSHFLCFSINLAQLAIAIQTVLIVLPLSELFVQLFNFAARSEYKNYLQKKYNAEKNNQVKSCCLFVSWGFNLILFLFCIFGQCLWLGEWPILNWLAFWYSFLVLYLVSSVIHARKQQIWFIMVFLTGFT